MNLRLTTRYFTGTVKGNQSTEGSRDQFGLKLSHKFVNMKLSIINNAKWFMTSEGSYFIGNFPHIREAMTTSLI